MVVTRGLCIFGPGWLAFLVCLSQGCLGEPPPHEQYGPLGGKQGATTAVSQSGGTADSTETTGTTNSGGSAESGGTTSSGGSAGQAGKPGSAGATIPASGGSNAESMGGALANGGASGAGRGGRETGNGGAAGNGGSASAGDSADAGVVADSGGVSRTGDATGTGGAIGTGGTMAPTFDWGSAAYNSSGGSSVSYQGHYTGRACLESCHNHSMTFGGTIYQPNGTTAAANAQVGIIINGKLTTTYSGSRGNFYGNISGTVNWATAQIAIRTAASTLIMPGNPSANGSCNACHSGTGAKRIMTP